MIQKEMDELMIAIDAIPEETYTNEMAWAINQMGYAVRMQQYGLGPAEAREEYLQGYRILQEHLFVMDGFPEPTYGKKPVLNYDE